MDFFDAKILRGDLPTRQKLAERIDFYQKLRRKVHHPVEGMLAKGFSPMQTLSALQTINSNLGFYQDALAGFG